MQDINPSQQLQKINRIKVLDYVRVRDTVTRPEIADETGLSLSSVSNIVDYLIKKNFIIETGTEPSDSLGRKRIIIEYNPDSYNFICILIEADYIMTTITDLNGDILLCSKTMIDVATSEIVPLIFGQAQRMMENNKSYEIIGIGIAFSGLVLNEGNYTISSTLKWESNQLLSQLEDHFKLPIIIENTTRLFARSIISRNPDKNAENILFFDFSDGIGLVYYSQGEIKNDLIGELGHVNIVRDGKKCICGNYGCLERECSVDSIVEKVSQLLAEGKCGILADKANDGNLPFDIVVEAGRDGDTDVISVLTRTGELIGTVFADMVFVFNPDRIIINEGRLLESDIIKDTIIDTVLTRPFSRLTENLTIEHVKTIKNDVIRGLAHTLSDRVFDPRDVCDFF